MVVRCESWLPLKGPARGRQPYFFCGFLSNLCPINWLHAFKNYQAELRTTVDEQSVIFLDSHGPIQILGGSVDGTSLL